MTATFLESHIKSREAAIKTMILGWDEVKKGFQAERLEDILGCHKTKRLDQTKLALQRRESVLPMKHQHGFRVQNWIICISQFPFVDS